ncbi:hypothetical protein DV735_g4940, partial [Chaetothyriales sp. CBS 134920]
MIHDGPVVSDPMPVDCHVPLSAKRPRNDIAFPLPTARRRVPSVASLTDLVEQDGASLGHLTLRAGTTPPGAESQDGPDADVDMPDLPLHLGQAASSEAAKTAVALVDLPPEVQARILDHIFGDMHSVTLGSTSLRGKSVASLMRHPRRKAVSNLALVCPLWRELVQERIYRHIKIKGTRAGMQESQEFFIENSHLTRHVRHIEFWVPVWGDRSSLGDGVGQSLAQQRHQQQHDAFAYGPGPVPGQYIRAHPRNGDHGPIDIPGITYPLSVQSATLAEIFQHLSIHFPAARVLTLEGGHCKKSNMIRHFSADRLFEPKQFAVLPGIRTFAMRGAWNIMRSYRDWLNIAHALPCVEEWHCAFAKPRPEAEEIVNQIALSRPHAWRSVNVSLDGMYSKDPMPATLHSTSAGASNSAGLLSSGALDPRNHLCENIGAFLPDLESLSYTGRICECMWKAAIHRIQTKRIQPKLAHLEIVVKSCCRQRVTTLDPLSGQERLEELGGIMSDGAGISNLVFIKAFERLVLHTVEALRWFPKLTYVRIRFIDLDSPCTQLNPYWQLENGTVWGIWSEEIVELLHEVRPQLDYVELADASVQINGNGNGNTSIHPNAHPSVSAMYPRVRPRSIKTSSYRVLVEARGQ